MSASRYPLFAAVSPGLESLLCDEWARLMPDVKPSERRGGVAARGTLEELRAFLVHTRLAESARVRVGTFEARSFEDLQRGVERTPWHAWVPEGTMPTFKVVCRKSRLYHSGAVGERVRQTVDRCLRQPPTREHGTVHVRIVKDRVTLSVDAAGELLHKRGWRAHVATASFRETMAATLLAASGWTPAQPLWDPFCGAGTIPIEAATIAAGQLPHAGATFDMDAWPIAKDVPTEAASPAVPASAPASYVGTDVSSDAISAAGKNLASAELPGWVAFHTASVENAVQHAPQGAAVVTNLPYGKRLKEAEVNAGLRAFSAVLRARPDLGPVVALSNRAGLNKATGLTWEPVFHTSNRGISVHALRLVR